MKKNYDMSDAKSGAVVSAKGKTRVTLYLDNQILDHYRGLAEKEGRGYQTILNETLLAAMKDKKVDSIATLRRVIREELKKIA